MDALNKPETGYVAAPEPQTARRHFLSITRSPDIKESSCCAPDRTAAVFVIRHPRKDGCVYRIVSSAGSWAKANIEYEPDLLMKKCILKQTDM